MIKVLNLIFLHPLFVINTDFEFEPKVLFNYKANPFGDDKNLPILKITISKHSIYRNTSPP